MNQLFNIFNGAEIPSLILCNPNKTEMYSLPLASEIKNTLRYNALSELTFSYPQSDDGGITIDSAYSFIKGKMIVLVSGVGFYIISDCPEDNSGAVPVKNVSCLSLESEMLSRRLTGFTGTYAFAELLQIVLDLIPTWAVGTIDSSLLLLYRTFSANNSTVYNFIMNDMAKAYGTVFEFDSFNKTISAISTAIPAESTNIFLSFDNLVSKIEYKEITEEICTALYCYGNGSLDIRDVNPLGTNAIYNFDYFKTSDWMSSGLISALDAWEAKVAIQQPIYAAELTTLKSYNNEMIILQADMSDLIASLVSMENIREARLQQGLNTVEIDASIAAQQILITSKGIDIASEQINIDNSKITLRKIVHSLFFTSQISYTNFEDDVSDISIILIDMLTSWTDIYNSTSTSPGFDPALLVAQTPTINDLIFDAGNEINILLTALVTGYSTYPPSESEITLLTSYINDEITTLNSLYSVLQSIIPNTSITVSIDNIRIRLLAYLDIISYSSNMTEAQYLELSSYIFENSYTNSNIITTDSMTPVEIQDQSQALYDQAITVLAKTSIPRYEFSGEFSNFVALKEFSSFTDELELGKVISIRKDDNTIIEAVLLEMSITYDNPIDFSMIFSNAFRLDNPVFIYTDVLGSAAQTGSNSGSSPVTEGSIAGWTVSARNMSVPNAQINSQGFVSFGIIPPSLYGNNVGAWFGYSDAPKMSLYSNVNNYLKWDGSKLLVKAENFTLDSLGNITATSATLSGDITATTGYIGGWTIGATVISSTGVTMTSGASASLAFGVTPPTSPTVGTGIYIDKTGLFGLNANVQECYINSIGQLLAGGGAVKLDEDGETILATSSYSSRASYKISDGTNIIGEFYGIVDDEEGTVAIGCPAIIGKQLYLVLYCNTKSGQAGFLQMVMDNDCIFELYKSNTNVYHAEFNTHFIDMDTIINGDTVPVITVDAGLDSATISKFNVGTATGAGTGEGRFSGEVIAARFMTVGAGISTLTNNWTTIYTFPNTAVSKGYEVWVNIGYTNDAANWGIWGVVIVDGASARLIHSVVTSVHSMQMSGLNLDVWQNSGNTQTQTAIIVRFM